MVSVIVPIKNMEPYLPACLDSLLAQTEEEIEILLVENASTDASPGICDAYAARDGRVRACHVPHPVQRRNWGIDHARGEWLMFVDADDRVEPDFCALPLRAALENDADLVIFGMNILRPDTPAPDDKKYHMNGVISRQQAIEGGRVSACNKLYSRRLFGDDLRFCTKCRFADVASTYRFVHRAERIYALDVPLYDYRIRPGSMSTTRDEQTFRDLYLAHWQRYRDLCAWGYDREPLDRLLLSESLQFLMSMEPSDDPLFLRADGFVSGWQGETDGLYAVYRNALKLWRIDKTLFHTYWRGRGYKVRPSCPPAYLDERKGS